MRMVLYGDRVEFVEDAAPLGTPERWDREAEGGGRRTWAHVDPAPPTLPQGTADAAAYLALAQRWYVLAGEPVTTLDLADVLGVTPDEADAELRAHGVEVGGVIPAALLAIDAGPTRDEWADVGLGRRPDGEIARELGVPIIEVATARRERGIESYAARLGRLIRQGR